MNDSKIDTTDNDKQIEDVIDARKKKGQYDVCTQSQNTITCRFAYSAPSASITDERTVRFDEPLWMKDGELNNCSVDSNLALNIGPTDSEITVVRVKREGMQFKLNHNNNWDMHDEAIPGDGTHLGESPSMVNLVTLVRHSLQSIHPSTYEGNEYLVPLSSWDPSDKPHELPIIYSEIEANPTLEPISQELNFYCNPVGADETKAQSISKKRELHVIKAPEQILSSKLNIGGKITHFLKKYCLRKNKEVVLVSSRESTAEVSPKDKEQLSNTNENQND